jgi:hypothetical protein
MTRSRRRLATLFKGTVPKHAEFPEANEDRLCACDRRQVYVLSDGASESYNSALWAELIVDAWAAAPPGRRVVRWLRKAMAEYDARSDTAKMSWSQQAAFERGSFASLLALSWDDESNLRATAVGDSVVLVVTDSQLHWSFPYTTAEQFRARPELLSTVPKHNLTPFLRAGRRAIKDHKPGGPCHAVVPLTPRDGASILCVTDALGAWLLSGSDDRSERLRRILSVTSENALLALVEEERAAGRMRRDDTTLLTLREASDVAADA